MTTASLSQPAMRRLSVIVAVAALGVGVFAATWWLIGDLSEDPLADEDRLDYLIEIDVDPALEAAAGVVGLFIASASTLWLLSSCGRNDGAPWIRAAAAVTTAGAVAGGGLRIMSAGVYGANIGGGMVMMFGVPLVIALLTYAAVALFKVRWRERGSLPDAGSP